MGSGRPVDVAEREFKWHVTVGIEFPAIWLDDRQHWGWQGIDPDKQIKKVRACNDREGRRRGLMFIGEIRKGNVIVRQYIVPTFWLWVKRVLGLPRFHFDRDGIAWHAEGLFWPRLEKARKETR